MGGLVDQRQRQRRAIYALVAGLLLVVGLTAGVFLPMRTPSPDRRVLAHIEMERELLSARWDVSRRCGTPVYASKNGAVHLVLNDSKGPVIVLLMPKEFVWKRVTIESKKLEGMILPTCNGSMAAVGQHGEQLLQVAQKMRQAVSWSL